MKNFFCISLTHFEPFGEKRLLKKKGGPGTAPEPAPWGEGSIEAWLGKGKKKKKGAEAPVRKTQAEGDAAFPKKVQPRLEGRVEQRNKQIRTSVAQLQKRFKLKFRVDVDEYGRDTAPKFEYDDTVEAGALDEFEALFKEAYNSLIKKLGRFPAAIQKDYILTHIALKKANLATDEFVSAFKGKAHDTLKTGGKANKGMIKDLRFILSNPVDIRRTLRFKEQKLASID